MPLGEPKQTEITNKITVSGVSSPSAAGPAAGEPSTPKAARPTLVGKNYLSPLMSQVGETGALSNIYKLCGHDFEVFHYRIPLSRRQDVLRGKTPKKTRSLSLRAAPDPTKYNKLYLEGEQHPRIKIIGVAGTDGNDVIMDEDYKVDYKSDSSVTILGLTVLNLHALWHRLTTDYNHLSATQSDAASEIFDSHVMYALNQIKRTKGHIAHLRLNCSADLDVDFEARLAVQVANINIVEKIYKQYFKHGIEYCTGENYDAIYELYENVNTPDVKATQFCAQRVADQRSVAAAVVASVADNLADASPAPGLMVPASVSRKMQETKRVAHDAQSGKRRRVGSTSASAAEETAGAALPLLDLDEAAAGCSGLYDGLPEPSSTDGSLQRKLPSPRALTFRASPKKPGH